MGLPCRLEGEAQDELCDKSTDEQLLKPEYTNIAGRVQAGHPALVGGVLCLAWVDVKARVDLSPRLVPRSRAAARAQIDLP